MSTPSAPDEKASLAGCPSNSAAPATDDDAAWSGALGRAAGVAGSAGSASLRALGALYRVPLKTFRQNKFDLAEGHAAAATPGARKPLQSLLASQGRARVLARQVVPSLAANVAVGSVMFHTFDASMASIAQASANGVLPRWIASNTLSTGSVAPLAACPTSPHSHTAAFMHSYTGPDVFIAGALAGAAQTPLVTPMENSSTLIRIRYEVLRAASSAAAASASAATPAAASASTLEATATLLMPPAAPNGVHSQLNLASSLRDMLLAQTSPGSRACAFHGSLPPVHLFSHLSFRLTRDSLGLGLFFYAFEAIHARMKAVPYKWMEMQEEQAAQLPSAIAAASSPSSGPLSLLPSGAPLLGSLLAWDVVSVVTAGVVSGSAYHVSSYPFFSTLQRIEARQMRAATGGVAIAPTTASSAWAEFRHVIRTEGWRALFTGVFGDKAVAGVGSVASTSARRPRLLNPLVLGLVVFTLSKTEHHTHQLEAWREQRRLTKQSRQQHAHAK